MSAPVVFALEGEEPPRYMFWCPGCETGHWFSVPPWTFDGDMVNPTVRASILVRGPAKGDGRNPVVRCHLFVTDGAIRFLTDCDHALAGQTVPMEPPP